MSHGNDKDLNQLKNDEQWERHLLERLAFASVSEQRKTRRWGIFFKLFFLGYLGDWGDKALPGGDYAALVDMNGVISSDSQANADFVITGLRKAFESKAKGILFRTNSPGGSPVQAGYINDEIIRLKKKYPEKPIYAVVGDICASGCYYAVASADKIYANKASIVGSIGVLMDGFGFVEGMKKLGIERRLITAGDNKGILDPFSPLKAKDKKHAKKMLNEIHGQFIDVVRKGRGDALKPTPDMFSGLFWTGQEAMEMGLVDALGSAGYVAREVIGTEEIVDFTYQEEWFERFAGRLGASIANTLATRLSLDVTGLQ